MTKSDREVSNAKMLAKRARKHGSRKDRRDRGVPLILSGTDGRDVFVSGRVNAVPRPVERYEPRPFDWWPD